MVKFGCIDKHGNLIAILNRNQRRIIMTFHTILIGNAFLIKNLPDLMRRMAVYADRYLVRFLGPEFAADDLAMHFFDLPVALLAGVGNIGPVNRGTRIVGLEDIVRGMAIAANRGYRQTLLKEANTVDGLRIMAYDAVLGNIVGCRNFGTLFVTATAHKGYIKCKGARILIVNSQDIMIPVAVPASGSKAFALLGKFTMQAVVIYPGNIIVADRTVGGFEVLIMGQFSTNQVLMTVGAFQHAMNGMFEGIQINENRHLAALHLAGKVGILMAEHTLLGVLRTDNNRKAQSKYRHKGKYRLHPQ